jgi:hypothetical protein
MRRDESGPIHGRSGWRFEWRPDRLQRLHELGRAFELTEDSRVADDGDQSESPPSAPPKPNG